MRGQVEPALVQPQELVERLRLDAALAGEHLVEHEAERVQVALHRHRAARELLGRHVGRRAGPRVRAVVGRPGDAEVGEAHVPLAVDHHVRRLEVAVQHAPLVRGGEAGAQLPRHLDRLVLRQPPDAAQQRREVLAVDVLHREVRPAVDLADVVHAADVLVGDLARDAHLVVELREARGIGGDGLGQELQRHGLVEAQVVGAVHLAHAAASEQADDAVAVVDDGAGREAPTVTGRQRGGRRVARRAARAAAEAGRAELRRQIGGRRGERGGRVVALGR